MSCEKASILLVKWLSNKFIDRGKYESLPLNNILTRDAIYFPRLIKY
ncbi:hypothetical protein NTGHW29_20021 [Candidatus Nitrotoga sp. HW29]|nr:hypothetical protein NTGHW29_20021 [Candidatus Nitrotoga sp. HW29]